MMRTTMNGKLSMIGLLVVVSLFFLIILTHQYDKEVELKSEVTTTLTIYINHTLPNNYSVADGYCGLTMETACGTIQSSFPTIKKVLLDYFILSFSIFGDATTEEQCLIDMTILKSDQMIEIIGQGMVHFHCSNSINFRNGLITLQNIHFVGNVFRNNVIYSTEIVVKKVVIQNMYLKLQHTTSSETKMISLMFATILNSFLEVADGISFSMLNSEITNSTFNTYTNVFSITQSQIYNSEFDFFKNRRNFDSTSIIISSNTFKDSEISFREIDKVRINGCKFYNLKAPLQFSYSNFISMKTIQVYNSTLFIRANSVYNMDLSDIIAINDPYLVINKGSYIWWDSVGTATITNSKFNSISASSILAVGNYVKKLIISNSQFYNVKDIDIQCSVDINFKDSNVIIDRSMFDSLEGIRGSISIRACSNVMISNSILKNSKAYAGGALYVSSVDQLTMYNLQFSNNVAVYRERNMFQSFGSGGGAFVHAIHNLNGNNITFTNNTGLKGGALYLAHYTVNNYNLNINCISNKADFTGGCYFLYMGRAVEIDKIFRNKITVGTNEDNKALIYGNQRSSSIHSLDFNYCTVANIDRGNINSYKYSNCIDAVSFKNISRLDTIRITLFPGQVVNMTSTFYDMFGEYIPLIKTTNVATNMTGLYFPHFDFKNKDTNRYSHSNTVPYFTLFIKTKSVVESNLLNNGTEYLFYMDSDSVVFNMSITLMDCPDLMEMKYDGNGLYICKDKVRYDIILPCSIVGGIFLLLSGFLLGYILIYSIVLINTRVVKRLKKLKKIEHAENELERNIIEKTFDYKQINYHNYYDSSSKFSINNIIDNIFDSNNKKQSYGIYKSDSKSIPLIDDEDQELSSHESRAMYYSTSQEHNTEYLKNPTQKPKSNMFVAIENLSIISKIGQGGSGVVYKGLLKPNTLVALKSLVTSSLDDEEVEKMNEEFESEVSLMKSLRHPNILNLYGISQSGNTKYMVIEYMENGSLENILYKSKTGAITLKLEEKIHILLGVSRGVNYLHSLNPCIIHRDLKPGNILLDKNYNAKISDFGLSKIFQKKSNLTKAVGTLYYLSPEMYGENSSTDINNKLDSYSFGIILWEVLFEDIPYTGTKISSLSTKISHVGSYSSNSSTSDEFTPFNVPQKVMNGVRPIIPFTNDREYDEYFNEYPFYSKEYSYKTMKSIIFDYIKLMKKCWSNNPKDRPEFSQIIKELQNITSNR